MPLKLSLEKFSNRKVEKTITSSHIPIARFNSYCLYLLSFLFLVEMFYSIDNILMYVNMFHVST